MSIRFTKDEEKRLQEMMKSTGLTKTALIKKCLFDSNADKCPTPNILKELGEISTGINMLKLAVVSGDNSLINTHIKSVEEGVGAIWRNLKS